MIQEIPMRLEHSNVFIRRAGSPCSTAGRMPATTALLQILGVQALQIFGQEEAVFADEFAVEPDFAAAPFFALDEHHVPVDGALVAIAAILVRLARREVQRAGDLLIEEDVAHGALNVRIEAEGKFPDVAGAGI